MQLISIRLVIIALFWCLVSQHQTEGAPVVPKRRWISLKLIEYAAATDRDHELTDSQRLFKEKLRSLIQTKMNVTDLSLLMKKDFTHNQNT